MTVITLSDEQARIISSSTSPVFVLDPKGRAVGHIEPLASTTRTEEEDIAEIKRRMAKDDGSRKTLAEVIGELSAVAPPRE